MPFDGFAIPWCDPAGTETERDAALAKGIDPGGDVRYR